MFDVEEGGEGGGYGALGCHGCRVLIAAAVPIQEVYMFVSSPLLKLCGTKQKKRVELLLELRRKSWKILTRYRGAVAFLLVLLVCGVKDGGGVGVCEAPSVVDC